MLFNKDEQTKIKKLHDSVKDSDALAKLAYEFGQMGSYFDRANSPRSREILSKEDENKYREFVRKAIQVKAQLQKDLAGMKKGMTQEQKLGWYKTDKNKTIRLLEDGISRLSWISYDMHDNTGKKLADELKQLLKEYEMLLEEGPRAFDSKTKDKKVKDATYIATFWRENPQFKNGGYETTRTIEAETMAEAKKKARQMVKGVLYGSMTLKSLVKSTKDSKVKDAGELQYPAVSSTHPNIISSTLNHIEEELKYAKVEGDKRSKTRVFRMLSEAREYYDRYKKECDNFEKFVKEYRKYLEDQYKRIMNLDAEATNFKGW